MHFSSSSLRKTHACKAGLLGPVGLAEAAHRAGWATNAAGQSTTVARYYNLTASASAGGPLSAPVAPSGFREADRPRIPMEYVVGLIPPTAAIASGASTPSAVRAHAPSGRKPRPPSPRKRKGKRVVFYPAVEAKPPKKARPPNSYIHDGNVTARLAACGKRKVV